MSFYGFSRWQIEHNLPSIFGQDNSSQGCHLCAKVYTAFVALLSTEVCGQREIEDDDACQLAQQLRSCSEAGVGRERGSTADEEEPSLSWHCLQIYHNLAKSVCSQHPGQGAKRHTVRDSSVLVRSLRFRTQRAL